MVLCHELSHAFVSYLAYAHGLPETPEEPSAIFYSPYSGLRPNEKHSHIPYPKNKGEAGKAFEFLAWGGATKTSFIDTTDSGDCDPSNVFLEFQHVIRTNVDGDYKLRVIPDELTERFFNAPEGQWITYQSFKTGPVSRRPTETFF